MPHAAMYNFVLLSGMEGVSSSSSAVTLHTALKNYLHVQHVPAVNLMALVAVCDFCLIMSHSVASSKSYVLYAAAGMQTALQNLVHRRHCVCCMSNWLILSASRLHHHIRRHSKYELTYCQSLTSPRHVLPEVRSSCKDVCYSTARCKDIVTHVSVHKIIVVPSRL